MNELINWLCSLNPFTKKTVILPNKNFHFELRKSLATRDKLKYLFNCELLTPTGFTHLKLHELDGSTIIDFQDIMYSFHVCLQEDLFKELKYFDKTQLKDGTGYAESFARTILELDQGGLGPEALLSFELKDQVDQQNRINDVGVIWREINKMALNNNILSTATAIEKLMKLDHGQVYWLGTEKLPFIIESLGEKLGKKDIFLESSGAESLDIESWASAEEEDRATLYWIIENIEKGYDLSELGIITASARPRLISYINYYFAKEMVYAPRGIDNATLGAGADIRNLLEAVRENLPAARMPRVFKKLIPDPDYSEPEKLQTVQGVRFSYIPKSEADWIDVVNATGSLGGNRANSRGIEDWKKRIYQYWPQTHAYSQGINIIVELAEKFNDEASLKEFGDTLRKLIKEQLRVSKLDQNFITLFLDEIDYYSQRPWASEVKGENCLNFIIDILTKIKSPCGKLGDNKIFLGDMTQALGLQFKAIRLIGMQEGSFPRVPKQDPILSDDLRELISPVLDTTLTRLTKDNRAFDFLINQSSESISLSTYSQNIDGTEKSYSGVFLDILDRLDIQQNLQEQFKHMDHKRKQKINEMVASHPYLEFSRLGSIKREPHNLVQSIPKKYSPLKAAVGSLITVDYSGAYARELNIDLTQTLSPSMVGSLLACPQQYLFEQILGYDETDTVMELGSVDAMSRGTMIHWIIEQIDREMGFVKLGQMDASEKDQVISTVINKCIEQFPISNFHGSAEALQQEIERFEDIIEKVIARDTQLAVVETNPEKKIEFKLGKLNFRGKVDRVEKLSHGKYRIVDFKSGRGYNKARENNPFEPGYDIQLLLYMKGLIDNGFLKKTDIEALEFRYPESSELDSREFIKGDLSSLLSLGAKWFEFIEKAHEEQYFPANPSESNCHYCVYAEVCDQVAPENFNSPAAKLFRDIRGNEEQSDE